MSKCFVAGTLFCQSCDPAESGHDQIMTVKQNCLGFVFFFFPGILVFKTFLVQLQYSNQFYRIAIKSEGIKQFSATLLAHNYCHLWTTDELGLL
jgi:hypothetical protein